MPELLVPPERDGQRLVDVCWARLATVARRAIGPLIAAGELTLDGATAAIAQPVRGGQRLGLATTVLQRLAEDQLMTPPSPEAVEVVYDDGDLLVLDKPSGMHVHPVGPHRDDTLLGCALWLAGARPSWPWTDYRPAPAHRLDRPTSGLVMFARSGEVQGVLQTMFERHEVRRTYVAEVEGAVVAETGTIEEPLAPDPVDSRRPVRIDPDGRPARSHWHVLGRDTATTSLRLTLDTGRTHQLRAHLAHIGHPIVGDVLYGAKDHGPSAAPDVGGTIRLRAASLSLTHPRTGAPIQIDAPPVRPNSVQPLP